MKNSTRGPATHNSPAVLPAEFLTVRHAADYAIVSMQTVRRWLKDGLPYFRAGSQIRIAKEDLVDFLRKGGSGHHCENP